MVGFEVIDLRGKYRNKNGGDIEYELVNPGRTKIFDYEDLIDIIDSEDFRDKPVTHQVSVTVPCLGNNEHSFFCFGYIQYIFQMNLRGEHDIYPQSLTDELYFFDSLKEQFAGFGNTDFGKIENLFITQFPHLPDSRPEQYRLDRKNGRINNYGPGITVDKNYLTELYEEKIEQIEYNISTNTCFASELEKYKPIYCVRGQYKGGITNKGHNPECTDVNFFLYTFKDLSNCKFGFFMNETLKMRLAHAKANVLLFKHTLHARRPNTGRGMDPGIKYINNFEIKLS